MAAFKCKIINASTHDLIIKIVGANAQFNLHLAQNTSFITPQAQFLNEGERLVIGWDDFDENIVSSGKITIDKKKKITLKDGGVFGFAPGPVSVEEEDDPTL